MFDGESFTFDAEVIAGELADCRQRGIERIDRKSHNQAPLPLPQLDRLSIVAGGSTGQATPSRPGRIKDLLRRALASYGEQRDPAEAAFVSDLFFGDSTNFVVHSAGELLDRARARAGEQNEDRFRERRRVAFHEFAQFLIQYAAGRSLPATAAPGPSGGTASRTRSPIAGGPTAHGGDALGEPADLVPSGELGRIETALDAASSITICGVAPRSLVQAMQRIAQRSSASPLGTPWRRITYVTPAAALIFTTLGNARIASAIQNWQSAIKGIHDCVIQLQSVTDGLAAPTVPELTFLSVAELFLNVLVMVKSLDGEHEQIWASVGPELAREEPCYLGVAPGTESFRQLRSVIERLTASGAPIVSRELEMQPDGLDQVRLLDESTERRLYVRSLRPLDDSSPSRTLPEPSCLPVALIALRSVQAGRPQLVLKRRSRYADWDAFDKLSLLSTGLLEEDLAAALGVPAFPNLEAPIALDAMWKAHGQPGPLPIPPSAFVRAAQREVFASCGLEISSQRFVHRGCHLLERDEFGRYLFFCVFELTLLRAGTYDELQLTRDWDPERLIEIPQTAIYSPELMPELNRFLIQCRDWFETEVLANPVHVLSLGSQE